MYIYVETCVYIYIYVYIGICVYTCSAELVECREVDKKQQLMCVCKYIYIYICELS